MFLFTITDVLLNTLHGFLNILHQVSRLTVKNFTQLHYGINGHAPIVYQTIHSFGVELIGFAQVYFPAFGIGL